MKLDEIKKLIQKLQGQPEMDHQRMLAFLKEQGIDSANLYQELEMSSRYVNTHRDTSYFNETVSLHSHNYIEVIYCRSNANVEYLIGSSRYRLQEGDIICVPPGVSHRPMLPAVMEVPYERDVLWLSMEYVKRLQEMFPQEKSSLDDYSGPIRTKGTKWEFLGDLFRSGVLEEEAKRPGWEVAVIGNTMTIIANMKRLHMERSAGTMRAEKPELLDRIAAYIEKHYAEHITIEDLARQFYVSNSTVSHLFKQKMGVSVYRYITQRRLIAAKTLIGQKLPLEEISQRVGFSDYSTFYRAFKQEYGISPRQFAQL